MALLSVSNRDKKMIVWNFMEELWENYRNAIENDLSTRFKYMDFFNLWQLDDYFSQKETVLDIMKRYAKEKGYIKLKGDTVTITRNGLCECQKPIHDWD
jgi:hypothetical protein